MNRQSAAASASSTDEWIGNTFVRPGMRVCVVGMGLAQVAKNFKWKRCFVLPCGDGDSAVEAQLVGLTETLRASSA